MSDYNDDEFSVPDFIPDEIVQYEGFRDSAGFNQNDEEYYEHTLETLRSIGPTFAGDLAIVPRRMMEDTVNSEYSLISMLAYLLTLPAVQESINSHRPGAAYDLEHSLARDVIGNEVMGKLVRGAPSEGDIV